MLHRWLIRSVFLLPLVLCASGWPMSYVYYGALRLPASTLWGCDAVRGRLYLRMHAAYVTPGRGMPTVHLRPAGPFLLELWGRNILGFGWGTALFGERFVAIPFWFPTTLSVPLLFLVWRKPRPKNPGGAFPVEMKAKA